jgi:hypothetical protein
MPNWTFNKLKVIGDKDVLQKFKDALKSKTSEEALDAENVIPYDGVFSPDAMRRLVQQKMNAISNLYGSDEGSLAKVHWPTPNIIDWQNEHWGTKGGFLYSTLRHEEDNRLIYHFDSAWSIPYKLMKELYRQWPSLAFEYFFFSLESGFEGYEKATEGQVVVSAIDDLEFDDDGNPIFRILSYKPWMLKAFIGALDI